MSRIPLLEDLASAMEIPRLDCADRVRFAAAGAGIADRLHSLLIELEPGPQAGARAGYVAAAAWLDQEESL